MITFLEIQEQVPFQIPENIKERMAVFQIVFLYGKKVRIMQGATRIEVSLEVGPEFILKRSFKEAGGKTFTPGYQVTLQTMADVLQHLRNVTGHIDKIVACTIPICPYCGRETQIKTMNGNGSNLYMWRCEPCDAHVSCHKDTNVPMGVPAKRALRQKRIEAHAILDQFWKSAGWERAEVYNWLAMQMHRSRKQTHIGLFDEAQCKEAVALLLRLQQENGTQLLTERRFPAAVLPSANLYATINT